MANPNPVPRPENLRPPWQPGQSGNPAGYSRARRTSDELIALIGEKGADKALARRWLQSALEGDFRFFKELLDRTEGKVPDKLVTETEKITELKWEDAIEPDHDAPSASGTTGGTAAPGEI